MLKIIGILLIVASCSAIGFLQSKSYNQRVDGIKSFIDAFSFAKAEIVFKNSSTAEVYNMIANRCKGWAKDFFEYAYSSGERLNIDILKTKLDEYGINQAEKAEILRILSTLGKYDGANQADIIDVGIQRLEDLYKQAQTDVTKNGKLSSAFGVTAGIVIAILLL